MKRNIKEQLQQIKTIYDAITHERRLTMESLNKFEAILEKIYNMVMKPSKPDDSKNKADKNNPSNTDRSETTPSIKIDISNYISCNNRNEPEIKKKSRWDMKQVVATDQLFLKLGNQLCHNNCEEISDKEKQYYSDISFNNKPHLDRKANNESICSNSSQKNESTAQPKPTENVISCINSDSDNILLQPIDKIEISTSLLKNNDSGVLAVAYDNKKNLKEYKQKSAFASDTEINSSSLCHTLGTDKMAFKFQVTNLNKETVIDLTKNTIITQQKSISKPGDKQLKFSHKTENLTRKNVNIIPDISDKINSDNLSETLASRRLSTQQKSVSKPLIKQSYFPKEKENMDIKNIDTVSMISDKTHLSIVPETSASRNISIQQQSVYKQLDKQLNRTIEKKHIHINNGDTVSVINNSSKIFENIPTESISIQKKCTSKSVGKQPYFSKEIINCHRENISTLISEKTNACHIPKTPVSKNTSTHTNFLSKPVEKQLYLHQGVGNYSKKNADTVPLISKKTISSDLSENTASKNICRNTPTDLIDNNTYKNLKTAVKFLGLSEDVNFSMSDDPRCKMVNIDSTYKDISREMRTKISKHQIETDHEKDLCSQSLKKPTQKQYFLTPPNSLNVGVQFSCSVNLPQNNSYFNPVNPYLYPSYSSNSKLPCQTTMHCQPGNECYTYFPTFYHNQAPMFPSPSDSINYPISIFTNTRSSGHPIGNFVYTNTVTRMDQSTFKDVSQNLNEIYKPVNRNRETKETINEVSQSKNKFEVEVCNNSTHRSFNTKSREERKFNPLAGQNLGRQYFSSKNIRSPSNKSQIVNNYRRRSLNKYIPNNKNQFLNQNLIGQDSKRENNNDKKVVGPYNSCQRHNEVVEKKEHVVPLNKDSYVSPLSGLYNTGFSEPISSKDIYRNRNIETEKFGCRSVVDYQRCSKGVVNIDKIKSHQYMDKVDNKNKHPLRDGEKKYLEGYNTGKNISIENVSLNMDKHKDNNDNFECHCSSKPKIKTIKINNSGASKKENKSLCINILPETKQSYTTTTNKSCERKVNSPSKKNPKHFLKISEKCDKTTEISLSGYENSIKSIRGQNRGVVGEGKNTKTYLKESKKHSHNTKHTSIDDTLNKDSNIYKNNEKGKGQKQVIIHNQINSSTISSGENNVNSTSQTKISNSISENNVGKHCTSLTNVVFSSPQNAEKTKNVLNKSKVISSKNYAEKDTKDLFVSNSYDKCESSNEFKLFDKDNKVEKTINSMYAKKIKHQRMKQTISSETNRKTNEDVSTSIIKSSINENTLLELKVSEKYNLDNVNSKKRKLKSDSSNDCCSQTVKLRKEDFTAELPQQDEEVIVTTIDSSIETSFNNDCSIENNRESCNIIDKSDYNLCSKEFSELQCQNKITESKQLISFEQNPAQMLKNLFSPETIQAIHNLATLFSNLETMQNSLQYQDTSAVGKTSGHNEKETQDKELSVFKDDKHFADYSNLCTFEDTQAKCSIDKAVGILNGISADKEKLVTENKTTSNCIRARPILMNDILVDEKLAHVKEDKTGNDRIEDDLVKNIYINNCSFIVSDPTNIKKDSLSKEMSKFMLCKCVEKGIADNQVDKNEDSDIVDCVVTEELASECIKTNIHQDNLTNKQNNAPCSSENIKNVLSNKSKPKNVSRCNLKTVQVSKIDLQSDSSCILQDITLNNDDKLLNSNNEISKLKPVKHNRGRKRELEKIHDSLKSLPGFSDIMNYSGLRSCRLKADLEGKNKLGGKKKLKFNTKKQLTVDSGTDSENKDGNHLLLQNSASKQLFSSNQSQTETMTVVSLENSNIISESTQNVKHAVLNLPIINKNPSRKLQEVLSHGKTDTFVGFPPATELNKSDGLKVQSLSLQKGICPSLASISDRASHIPEPSCQETKPPLDVRIINFFSVVDPSRRHPKKRRIDDECTTIAKELLTSFESELNVSPFKKEQSDCSTEDKYNTIQEIREEIFIPTFKIKEEIIDDYE
uniref:Uncharacterized protein n=1 Tax=Cuerna arida TaxID=1464854 RepID=A0A1B6FTR6_9HEMI